MKIEYCPFNCGYLDFIIAVDCCKRFNCPLDTAKLKPIKCQACKDSEQSAINSHESEGDV